MRNYWQDKRVAITGGGGFVGRHLVSALQTLGCNPIVIRSIEYDLRVQQSVELMYYDIGTIDVLFHLAANVGGIGANQAHPADMYSDNVRMDTLLIEHAARNNVGCFVGMGSVCAYPKYAPIPFKETSLWDGYPEETNAAYGMAKRGMLTALMAYGAQYGLNWRYALSTNLYGPGDNYTESGHVIAHLIKRFSEAMKDDASVSLWGTGTPTRDFLYVDDVVRGLLEIAEHGTCEPVNLGSGIEVSIADLAGQVAWEYGYDKPITWDASKPDGQPRRVLDISRVEALGWRSTISLSDGIHRVADDYSGARVYA